MRLEEAVRGHLAEWETPFVELEVFGSDDPARIAVMLDDACRTHLGASVAGCLFYRSSIGSVAGLELDDGRSVVLKLHQPPMKAARLRAVQGVMRALSAAGFPCPLPLGGPFELANGTATVETHDARGVLRDAHEPVVRAELATRLAELVAITRDADLDRAALGGAWFASLPEAQLWPRPHSRLFDFEATAAGAEWIDAWARRARQVPLAGEPVVGHFDWRTEHARFDGDRIVVAYDWDSVHREREPVMVGAAAHAFTASWDDETIWPAPSVDEIESFVTDYERARGRGFSGAERASLNASCVYAIAYTARCQHAVDPVPASDRAAAFRDLLRAAGPALLQGASQT